MRVSGLDDNEMDNYFIAMMTGKEMRPSIEGVGQQGYRGGIKARAGQQGCRGGIKAGPKDLNKGWRKDLGKSGLPQVCRWKRLSPSGIDRQSSRFY